MDRRSWLGIFTLVALGLGYALLPNLYTRLDVSTDLSNPNNAIDISTHKLDASGPLLLEPDWQHWNIEPSSDQSTITRYSLQLSNFENHPAPDNLALLIQPACPQQLQIDWLFTSALGLETLVLAKSPNKPVLISLNELPEGINHQLRITHQKTLGDGRAPCLNLFIGTTEQLPQLISWSLMREITPLALLVLMLLTLIGRAYIQTYYQDLFYLGHVVTSLIAFCIAKSPSLMMMLSNWISIPTIYLGRISAGALIVASIAIGIYALRYINNNPSFKAKLRWTLIASALTIPLLAIASSETRHWLAPIFLPIIMANLLLTLFVITTAFRKEPHIDLVYKILLLLLIAAGLINPLMNLITDQLLLSAMAALVLVIRMNLTLYPLENTKLAPHEAEKLNADIHRHTSSLQEKNQQLAQAKEALRLANLELEALSMTDGLTGAYNRMYFDRQLVIEWQRARREQHHLTVILADIDHFKKINDHYGHLTGDECLKFITTLLQETFQRGGDFVCRYGGEEFVILLSNTDPEQASHRAEQARQLLSNKHYGAGSESIVMSISIGVASLVPSAEHQPLDLLHAADQALYWVKRNGRNGVKIAQNIIPLENSDAAID